MSTYLIVTLWSYPFGGGESFLYQTMEWANKIGMKSYWISFMSVNPNSEYKSLEVTVDANGTMIKVPGGFDVDNLLNWVKILNPQIVHTQGLKRKEIIETVSKLRIPVLTGYHFWTGIVDLHPTTYNTDIVHNILKHKKSSELDDILKNKYSVPYVCSDFMQEIVDRVCNISIPVMYASSSENTLIDMNILKNKFVTHINIHKLKGGDIFYELVRRLFDIPFIGIKTEPKSEELDEKITDLIKNKTDGSIIIEHTSNIKHIYSNTRILLVPSLVDETFCRVVNEGLMNGIPIVTTGAGNIKYLVGDAAVVIPPNDIDKWVNTISELYFDEQKLYDLSIKSKQQYTLFSEKVANVQFNIMVESSIRSSKESNVMIFVPFCDQGLGIQGRSYLNLLKDRFQVFIFSYLPYNADKITELQKDIDEWNYDKIYYSSNTREEVTDEEIVSFVTSNNIGKCIIPETCWARVFEVANLLNRLNVDTYAIPNIEIVRRDEVYKHRVFDKILCNNKLCEDHFRNFGFTSIENIGYSIEQKNTTRTKNDSFTFLCIGGMNAFTRKQVPEVCESFVKIYNKIKHRNPILIVTIQKFFNMEKLLKYSKHPAIRIINQHLSYSEINELYMEADVFIQVSKKEGLGLGFFEALSYGIPILTLDTAPHNEIVRDGINGWTCLCRHEPMQDNPEALLEDAIVDVDLLSEKMGEIINMYDMNNMRRSTQQDYKKRFSIKTFRHRLVKSIS